MRIKKGEEGDIGCMFLIYAHVELVVDQLFSVCATFIMVMLPSGFSMAIGT